ncbi:MAG: CAP domain-containing protein [Oscillospiraceae bacterium]|jgi:uncharacterized protein YkwD|nr:CAP domain-containing protein [Oscillospiraceae bacterium]
MPQKRFPRIAALALLMLTVLLGVGLRGAWDAYDSIAARPMLGAAQQITGPETMSLNESAATPELTGNEEITEPAAVGIGESAIAPEAADASGITEPLSEETALNPSRPGEKETVPALQQYSTEADTRQNIPPTRAAKPSNAAVTTTQKATAETPNVAGEQISWAQTEVLRLCNIEREKAGVYPLRYGTRNLQKAADVRAAESVETWEHARPNGRSWYTALWENMVLFVNAGENLAKGYENPETLVRAWMNSPAHRENILNPRFSEVSVGFCRGENGAAYWSQMFVGI